MGEGSREERLKGMPTNYEGSECKSIGGGGGGGAVVTKRISIG